jgi:hypothetical protein
MKSAPATERSHETPRNGRGTHLAHATTHVPLPSSRLTARPAGRGRLQQVARLAHLPLGTGRDGRELRTSAPATRPVAERGALPVHDLRRERDRLGADAFRRLQGNGAATNNGSAGQVLASTSATGASAAPTFGNCHQPVPFTKSDATVVPSSPAATTPTPWSNRAGAVGRRRRARLHDQQVRSLATILPPRCGRCARRRPTPKWCVNLPNARAVSGAELGASAA